MCGARGSDFPGSALHAPKHLDMLSAALRMLDVYDIFHQSSVAGESRKLYPNSMEPNVCAYRPP